MDRRKKQMNRWKKCMERKKWMAGWTEGKRWMVGWIDGQEKIYKKMDRKTWMAEWIGKSDGKKMDGWMIRENMVR